MITSHWFTNPINTNIILVWGAKSSVFHLARHCEKKLKVLSLAVQFTSIFLFHFRIGFPLVEPSTERFAVVFCTLLGSKIQAVFITRVNIAQLIYTARTRTELAAILRFGVVAVSLLVLDSSATSSGTLGPLGPGGPLAMDRPGPALPKLYTLALPTPLLRDVEQMS